MVFCRGRSSSEPKRVSWHDLNFVTYLEDRLEKGITIGSGFEMSEARLRPRGFRVFKTLIQYSARRDGKLGCPLFIGPRCSKGVKIK